MSTDWQGRIIVDDKILVGKPIIKGTRISVEFILELLACGWDDDSIVQNYPQLEKADIEATLRYAVDLLKEESVYPLP